MISQILRQPDYAVFRTSKSSGIGDQYATILDFYFYLVTALPPDCF